MTKAKTKAKKSKETDAKAGKGQKAKDFELRIVGFLCNWCSYAGADLAGVSRFQYPPNIRVIRVMCSSRVDPAYVIRALLDGADGVLIAGCHPGDCHYIEGNYRQRRRITALKRQLEGFGLADRLKLVWVSASEGQRFAQVVTDMVEQVKKLGPNPFRKKAF